MINRHLFLELSVNVIQSLVLFVDQVEVAMKFDLLCKGILDLTVLAIDFSSLSVYLMKLFAEFHPILICFILHEVIFCFQFSHLCTELGLFCLQCQISSLKLTYLVLKAK